MSTFDLERKIDAQTDAINKLVGVLGGGGGTARASTAPNFGIGGFNLNFLSNLERGTGAVLDSFGKLATGSYTLANAFSDVNGVLGKFGSIGTLFSTVVGKSSQVFLETNNSLKKVSDSGLYFSNNLGDYSESVTGARMSMTEFENIVKNNAFSMAGLGLGMDASGKTFLKLAKGIQEFTDESGNSLAYNLQRTGMRVQEFGELLVKNVNSRKFLDFSQEATQKAVIESTLNMAREMDNIARLTGISRQEQQKRLESQISKVEVQAKLASMTAGQQSNFYDTLVSLGKLGPELQNLYEEIATGGIRTDVGGQRAAAVGIISGAIQPMLEELQKVDKLDTPEAKERARVLREQIQLEYERGLASKQVSDQVAILGKSADPVAQIFKKLYGEGTQAAAFQAQVGYKMAELRATPEGAGMSDEQLRKTVTDRLMAEFERQRAGKDIKPEEFMSQMMNRMERLIVDVNASGGKAFAKINEEVGREIKSSFTNLDDVLKMWTPEKMAKAVENVLDGLKQGIGDWVKKNSANPVDVPKEAPLPSERLVIPKKNKERQVGSKGATGEWFEQFSALGEAVFLHGEEAVVPKAKIGEFINDMVTKMPELVGDLGGSLAMKSAQARQQSMFPTEQIQQMSSFFTNPQQFIGSNQSINTDVSLAITDLVKGVEKLNISILAVKQAVEDGTDKNVRATKSKGNMLA